MKPLGFHVLPTELNLWKQQSGRLHAALSPSSGRDPKPFELAANALKAHLDHFPKQFEGSQIEIDDDTVDAIVLAKEISSLLEDPNAEWSTSQQARADALADWLRDPPPKGKNPRNARAAKLISAASEIGIEELPQDAGRDLMLEVVPKFVLFRDQDRTLSTTTTLDGGGGAGMQPAIRNLLAVAELDAAGLYRAHAAGDTGEVETLLLSANSKLSTFFGQAWNQSNVTVRLSLEGDVLQTHVHEIDTNRITRVEERSDGLRAFIALAAFLEAQNLTVPPILLIDEAENHLHFDAQADLVGVLLKQVRASQVFYTTHSPGCLPSDLGTGIRVVDRKAESSELRSHFWTNESPGFAPLLFAMGAGAAAFSVCRWAVLAEGGADMVLLPTLIRTANDVDDLDYQVAPGLAHARASGMNVEEVAAKVVYLTDGDAAGKKYRKELMELASVPEARIFSLPDGMATEDLLDTDFLLDTIYSLMPAGSPKVPMKALQANRPVMLNLQKWAAAQSPAVPVPGKVAIAYAVIDQDNIVLRPEAQSALRELHGRFVEALQRNV